jgi:hypothetical protein
MSSRLTLAHLLADLGQTYHSIDVRSAVYRIEGKWYNLITIIRFSQCSDAECDENTAALWQQLREIHHERLKILRATFPYDDRQLLFDQFKSDTWKLDDINIQLGRSVDLLSDTGFIQQPGFGDPACSWPHLEIQGNRSASKLDTQITQSINAAVNDDDLRRHASTRGYDSVNEAIELFLGLRKNNHHSFSSEIYIWAPVFAKISEPRWNSDQSVTINYQLHPLVKSQFWLGAKINEGHQEQRALRLSPAVPGETEWDMEVQTDPVTEAVRIDTSLVHEKLGIVTGDAFFVKDLIPVKNVNPMWSLLQRFCSVDEFEKLLAIPGSAQDSENKPQRLFELRMSWLLAAYGFTCFVLGSHECLRDPGTRVERGSLDLLAFHEDKRVLILGSCKINAPKESDYDNLVNMRALLLQDLAGADSFQTHMVVFTAAAETRLYKMLETSNSGWFPRVIPIFDTNRLRAAIDALQNHHKNWIFEQLTVRAQNLAPAINSNAADFY